MSSRSALLDARFRASGLFAVVAHRDLGPDERAAFAELAGRSDYFGLIVPDSGSSLSTKLLDGSAARLLQELTSPGPLPSSLREHATSEDQRMLVRLVMDGVLEIETERGFVSGPLASPYLDLLPGQNPVTHGQQGVLQQLALEAMAFAVSSPTAAPLELASTMYRYNTVPLSPHWQRCLGESPDALEWLGLGSRSQLRALLFELYDAVDHPAWHQWVRADRSQSSLPLTPGFKLYVSVHPDDLAEAVAPAVEVLIDAEVPAFKLVRSVAGLLRPDKLVAYLDERSHLQDAAARLHRLLCGLRPHGVPFSCAITDDGMLSWGCDPPASEILLGWQRVESWRSWTTRRLAFALVQAGAVIADPMECCRFALDRLRLEHVDTDTWSPANDVWYAW